MLDFLRRYWLLLLLAIPFFVALDDSSVWDANEAFYVQTPREMLERGDWVVPYFNGRPRLNKPPLPYWIVALFYQTFGVALFWERFVMAALAYGSVLAVFAGGKILLGRTEALLAAGLFATSFRFLVLSRRYLIDILLLFCILWAIVFLLSWIQTRRKHVFLLSAVFFGLAFLAKGPVALLPLSFLAVYVFVSVPGRDLRHAPWAPAILIGLGLSSFWFLWLGAERGWEPVRDFFVRENWGRFADVDYGPRRGIFYYVPVFLGDFFPWSVFWIGAAVWSGLRFWWGERERWLLLLGPWMAVYFVVFSLSLNKQEYYILPLYPAAALWVAAYFVRARVPVLLSGAVTVLIAAAGLLLVILARALFSELPLWWLPFPLILGAAAGLLWRRPRLTVSGLALFYALFFVRYLAPLEQYRPVAHFARTIAARTANDSPEEMRAGYYRFTAPSLAFYLNEPVLELFELERAKDVLESDRAIYLIVNSEDYPELQETVAKSLEIVEVRPRLATTARRLIQGFRNPTAAPRDAWLQDIYLITNQE